MNFTESITTCFTKFFTIKGRASRSEYWWFHLMWVICYFILFLTADHSSQFAYALYWMIIGVLVIFLISFAYCQYLPFFISKYLNFAVTYKPAVITK